MVGAGVGVDRHEGGRYLRQLHDTPVLLAVDADAHDGAGRQPDRILRLRRQPRGGELQTRAGDVEGFAVDGFKPHHCWRGVEHHRRQQAVAGTALLQRLVDRVGALFRVGGQLDRCFRPAVAVTLVVGEHVAAQRLVGRILVGFQDGGGDHDALGVGLFLELRVYHLARQFGHVLGVGVVFLALRIDVQRLRQRLLVFGLGDVIQVAHAFQDHMLAGARAFRIDHRIVARRVLRQAGQHRHFRHRQRAERLAEVDLGGAAETVGALSEIDLVHVQLEDFVLRQRAFDLVGQRHFVEFAADQLFAREKEIARHLHRDSRTTLAKAPAQVRFGGAHRADPVDPAMVVKALVLDCQHRFLHQRRHLRDRHEVAVLLAEFADQDMVGGVNTQRDLRLVIGDRAD